MKDQEGSTGDMPTASDAAAPAPAKTHSHTEAEIQAWLISNIATLVEIDPGNLNRKAAGVYGMDYAAMHLSAILADWLEASFHPQSSGTIRR